MMPSMTRIKCVNCGKPFLRYKYGTCLTCSKACKKVAGEQSMKAKPKQATKKIRRRKVETGFSIAPTVTPLGNPIVDGRTVKLELVFAKNNEAVFSINGIQYTANVGSCINIKVRKQHLAENADTRKFQRKGKPAIKQPFQLPENCGNNKALENLVRNYKAELEGQNREAVINAYKHEIVLEMQKTQ